MTPKEKAKELIRKYMEIDLQSFSEYGNYIEKDSAKQCALIAADEILEFEKSIIKQLHKITKDAGVQFKVEAEFWEQVKQEIEKL